VVKLLFALLGTVTAAGVYRLARAFQAPEWGAVMAAALVSLAGPVIYFAPRAMAENACMAPLVWGLALLFDEEQPGRRKLAFASSLLGLSVLLRLQCAVVLVGVLLVLALKRRWSTLGLAFAVFAVWGVFYGALDAWTWHGVPGARFGGWFHSAFVYVQFNIIEGRGAHWGTSPWTFYFQYLFASMPGPAIALGLGVLGALLRRRWELPLLIAAFLAIHLVSPHKELRFVVPAIPLAAACLGIALRIARERLALLSHIAVALAALVSLVHFPSLTMGELGAYPERPQSSAWDDFGNINRLLLVASKQTDLCGLRMDAADMAWTGGSTYLHRDAPLYRPWVQPNLGHFNYLIGPPGYGAPLTVVKEDHGAVLYRLPIDRCEPDPGFSWQLG
jgi:hypothetical protein